jgi:GNAT superfamily N-acetyltransferase
VGQLFARLSAQSRHQRFLATKMDLTARELALLTSIDHVHHEALAAVDERDQSIVAIVRYVQVADRPGVADVAAEVADELQNMGIATMLAEATIERARANGFTTLHRHRALGQPTSPRRIATTRLPRSRERRGDDRARTATVTTRRHVAGHAASETSDHVGIARLDETPE